MTRNPSVLGAFLNAMFRTRPTGRIIAQPVQRPAVKSEADISAMLAAQTKRERRRIKCARDFAHMHFGMRHWTEMERLRAAS